MSENCNEKQWVRPGTLTAAEMSVGYRTYCFLAKESLTKSGKILHGGYWFLYIEDQEKYPEHRIMFPFLTGEWILTTVFILPGILNWAQVTYIFRWLILKKELDVWWFGRGFLGFFFCKGQRLEEIDLSAHRFLKVDLRQDEWVEKRGRRGEQEPERRRTLNSTAKQTVEVDPLLLHGQDILHTTI